MNKKVCTKCKKEKLLSEFNKLKVRKDGHRSTCRECDILASREYRDTHVEERRKYGREYGRLHAEERKRYTLEHEEQTRETKKRYILNHPEKRKAQARAYYHRHKEKVKEHNAIKKEENNFKRKIYNQTHPQARIAHNLRTRINAMLGGRSKGGRLHLLVGCDMNFLKQHLENLFTDNMDWGNYGMGMNKWCIDHIIPLDNFDLENEEEQKKAFHFSNLEPMWYCENASKSNRYIGKYKNYDSTPEINKGTEASD